MRPQDYNLTGAELEIVLKRRVLRRAQDRRNYENGRNFIFNALGRVCVKCASTVDLEFDVKIPVGGPKEHHGKMSSSMRVAFYKREHARGNIQILCTKCNSSKKDKIELPLEENKNEDPY